METRTKPKAHFSMPVEMKLEPPTLRIADIKGALAFYQNGLGLQVRTPSKRANHEAGTYELVPAGSVEPLLILKDDPEAVRPPPDFAGLYHYAVLVPSRRSLASTYLAVGSSGVPYDGFADHYVSEALYLHDAEENGVEIYADRSRDRWSAFSLGPGTNATAAMQMLASLNKPLDFESLLRELNKEERTSPAKFAEGARIGHMHLRVTDLERSVRFYNESLGLDTMMYLREMGAAFLSVGGYHHHLGLNVWNSRDGSPHKEGEAGLDRLAISVPERDALDRLQANLSTSSEEYERAGDNLSVRDPDGMVVQIRSR